MDKKDQQIVKELQNNGRLTNQELAERVNLSPSPCLRRVRNLEKEGIITGYGAMIDQNKFGLPITAFISVTLEQHSQKTVQNFEKNITQIDEILDCYLMAGGNDYLLRVIVESLETYEIFIRDKMHAIPSIASLKTNFAYGTIKQNRTFSNTPKIAK